MIAWSLAFLILSIGAAMVGFDNTPGYVELAKLVFFTSIVMFSISAVVALLRGRSPIA